MKEEKQVQILCNPDDENIDKIAERMNILNKAIDNGTLVAISCRETSKSGTYLNKILLAIIAKDEGEEFIEYSPIGTIFYEDDTDYMSLTPPSSALPVDKESNVEH